MGVMYSRLNPFEYRPEWPLGVAFGITDLDVGGAEKALVGLATRLDRSRWTPSVVCLQSEGPLAKPLRQMGIDVVALNIRSPKDVPHAFLAWRQELIKRRPAILQTFLFHANLLGRFVGGVGQVPAIVSGVRVAERRAKGHLLADRLTHRFSDAHVCVSNAVAEFQIAAASVPRSRVLVIPNGIDVPSSPPAAADWAALQLPAASARLVYVGRLEAQKGLDVLFDAFALFPAEQRPALAIVGAGPNRERLEAQANRQGLSSLVRFLGWRPNPASWIAAADALVLPSRWEGMPNVVLEAMAVGKPVIAANVEGVSDLVDDGATGWLAPPNDPSALAAAIRRSLADSRRWAVMGAAARRKAIEEFSFRRVVERYERLWLDLLERRRRRFQPASHRVVPNYRR
jgi:starch synthase (maltosyl-transferring)